MKIAISLESVPLKVEIEGADSAMTEVGIIVEGSIATMKKVWLESLKRQAKLTEAEK